MVGLCVVYFYGVLIRAVKRNACSRFDLQHIIGGQSVAAGAAVVASSQS